MPNWDIETIPAGFPGSKLRQPLTQIGSGLSQTIADTNRLASAVADLRRREDFYRRSVVRLYLVKEVRRDYLECVRCSLKDDGSVDASTNKVLVAKPCDFQPFYLDGETIDGLKITFPYSDPGATPVNQRHWMCQRRLVARAAQSAIAPTSEYWIHKSTYDAEDDATWVSWTQEIYPPYVPDKSVILVAKLSGSSALDLPAETFGTGETAVTEPALSLNLVDITPGRHWADLYTEVEGCWDGQLGKIAVRAVGPFFAS
jgi:hypothetical protein